MERLGVKMKNRLEKAINEYGLTDQRTIAISEEIHEDINKKQSELYKKLIYKIS